MGEKVAKILELVESLTVLELAELVKALEERFGISAVPVQAVAPSAPTERPQEEEKKLVTVVLQDAGSNKLQVIKEVRAITGLGLKEAKEFVESAPKVIREEIPPEEAQKIREALERVGAKVELK